MNMKKIIERGYYWIDDQARQSSLALARKLSRRSFLSRLGMMLAGAVAFPLLPVAALSHKILFRKLAIHRAVNIGAIAP